MPEGTFGLARRIGGYFVPCEGTCMRGVKYYEPNNKAVAAAPAHSCQLGYAIGRPVVCGPLLSSPTCSQPTCNVLPRECGGQARQRTRRERRPERSRQATRLSRGTLAAEAARAARTDAARSVGDTIWAAGLVAMAMRAKGLAAREMASTGRATAAAEEEDRAGTSRLSVVAHKVAMGRAVPAVVRAETEARGVAIGTIGIAAAAGPAADLGAADNSVGACRWTPHRGAPLCGRGEGGRLEIRHGGRAGSAAASGAGQAAGPPLPEPRPRSPALGQSRRTGGA